jgi:hypothetical protein
MSFDLFDSNSSGASAPPYGHSQTPDLPETMVVIYIAVRDAGWR